MRAIMLAAALSLVAFSAQAQSCKASASGKNLRGAALNSFMKKCQTDAQSACDKAATDRKLAGAARNSFTKKCVADAVGS